jgi:hypothetical protein
MARVDSLVGTRKVEGGVGRPWQWGNEEEPGGKE